MMIKNFLIPLFLYCSLYAHQTGLSFIDIKENTNDTYTVVYKKPLEDASAQPITIHYPQNCKTLSTQPKQFHNGFIIHKFELYCGSKGLQGERIWVEGLVRSDKGVMIYYKDQNFQQKALLRSTTPFIQISQKSSSFEYFKQYIALGIEHILSGYDHLLFVLSLVLLAANRIKSLLLAVTAFTVAHSITLALAVFDLITIPVKFVESMIALSIIFLARELLLHTKTITKQHLEYIAFIFGLLHGLGFSTALKEIGLPQEDLALALFSFNVGIELGQLFFITVALSILVILYRVLPQRKLLFFLAYMIGITASYWFIQRVTSF